MQETLKKAYAAMDLATSLLDELIDEFRDAENDDAELEIEYARDGVETARDNVETFLEKNANGDFDLPPLYFTPPETANRPPFKLNGFPVVGFLQCTNPENGFVVTVQRVGDAGDFLTARWWFGCGGSSWYSGNYGFDTLAAAAADMVQRAAGE